MAQFKKYLFEKLFQMDSGDVLNFSISSLNSFVEETVNIDLDSIKYKNNGTSKAKRLRAFWKIENDVTVGRLLSAMLDKYMTDISDERQDQEKALFEQCKLELDTLKNGVEFYNNKLDILSDDENITLQELKTTLTTDLNNRRYNIALDRLHTYCVKYFRAKAEELNIAVSKDKALHSLAGEVVKAINQNQSEMTLKILKNSLSILDYFNTVRNNQSLAHDNEILNNDEAKLISEWILNLLNFIDIVYQNFKANSIQQINTFNCRDDEVPF